MPETEPFALKSALIFLGAGSGGLLRYWLGGAVQSWWGPAFPVGTLLVNVTGCFAIGFLATALSGPILVRDELRQCLLIGVIGGYTTFSTFGQETMALADEREWARAGLYVLGSVALGLISVWLGAAIAERLHGHGPTAP